MLKCPKCESLIQVNLPPDSRIKDMVDLSRQARISRQSIGLTADAGAAVGVKCDGCGYQGDPLEFDPRSSLPKVVDCTIGTGGMVMAFDAEDNQVTECQGFILAVASELKIRCDKNTKWFFGKRDAWLVEAYFNWWFLDK